MVRLARQWSVVPTIQVHVTLVVKNPPANAGSVRYAGLIPGLGRSPGEGYGSPIQFLAWKIPWTEEPGGLQSIGWQRVSHDQSNLACTHAEWNGSSKPRSQYPQGWGSLGFDSIIVNAQQISLISQISSQVRKHYMWRHKTGGKVRHIPLHSELFLTSCKINSLLKWIWV